MTDMMVKLYELPELAPELARQRNTGVDIRRALPGEMGIITEWVSERFNAMWVSECALTLSSHPCSCFIAVHDGALVGFACYDASCKGFFGPTGVAEDYRGRGIGKALLLACLHDMLAQGYGYAIIGWIGPAEFYRKAVGAVEIANSTPGIYRGLLKR